jgi:hypothetical protein
MLLTLESLDLGHWKRTSNKALFRHRKLSFAAAIFHFTKPWLQAMTISHGDVLAGAKVLKICRLMPFGIRREGARNFARWQVLEFPGSDRSRLNKLMISFGEHTDFWIENGTNKKFFDELSQLCMESNWNVIVRRE